MARTTIFIVSDTVPKNFPSDENDLNRRLALVADWIPKKRGNNNIKFVTAAFTLLKDLGAIDKTLVDNLNDDVWCRRTFDCMMNPMPGGGVLRRKGLAMWSSNGLRYYCPYSELEVPADIAAADIKGWHSESKLAIICAGETFYISNNWFHDENRQQKKFFYSWLTSMARQICKARWLKNNF